jgi:hypothetical protein
MHLENLLPIQGNTNSNFIGTIDADASHCTTAHGRISDHQYLSRSLLLTIRPSQSTSPSPREYQKNISLENPDEGE